MRSRNPRLALDELEQQIADDLARDPASADERIARLSAQVHQHTIEAQLAHAEQRNAPRTAWPEDLRLPGLGLRPVQSWALRLLRLAFRDQQEVNAALIRAARESLVLAQALSERIAELEARLDRERSAERARRIAERRQGGDG